MREATRGSRVAWLVVALLLAGGCGVLGPRPLDVPSGHHAVLRRLDLSGLGVPEGTIELVKEDRSYEDLIHVGPGQREFAVTLPAGRYLVTRLRAFPDQHRFTNQPVWDLRLTLEVGSAPAVYVGTLRVWRRSEQDLRVEVVDEYDDTLRVLRRHYADLPATVARSLLQVMALPPSRTRWPW
jgi:hypothetical protein